MSDYSKTIQEELQQYQEYNEKMTNLCSHVRDMRKANEEKRQKHKRLMSRIRGTILLLIVAAALVAGYFYLDGKFEERTALAEAAIARGDYDAAYHVYDDLQMKGIMWGKHNAVYQQAKEGYMVQDTLSEAQDYAADGDWESALQTLKTGLNNYSGNQSLKDYAEVVIGAALDQMDTSSLGGIDGVLQYLSELQDAYGNNSETLDKAKTDWSSLSDLWSNVSRLDYVPDMLIFEENWRAATVATQKTGLFLRTGPGQDYDTVLTIPKGETVYKVGYTDSVYPWICVVYDGTYGWVNSDYLNF